MVRPGTGMCGRGRREKLASRKRVRAGKFLSKHLLRDPLQRLLSFENFFPYIDTRGQERESVLTEVTQ